MKTFRPPLAFLLAALLATGFFSCNKNAAHEIPLDTSDPLALAPDVQWAVVNDPYAAFRKDISWSADVAGYCKKGEYFPILAKTFAEDGQGGQTWYRFEDGWLPESLISVYPNKLRAAKAAAGLKN